MSTIYIYKYCQQFFFFIYAAKASLFVTIMINRLRAIDVINYPFVGIADISFARIAH